MSETPSIKSIEPFIMFDLPETPIEPSVLFPSVLWLKLLRYIRINADIAARYGFKIVLKLIPT
ncbi:MAG: hypothetical protein IM539_17335 [Pseudanabaena sp. M046S1SP1A06QC]|nr:hypothetical protein [Pseudanabaena sp. M046S1SP1A06QC]